MDKRNFGYTIDGKSTNLYILKTKKFELSVSDYGATLVNLIVNDKNGEPIDIVLGYDNVTGYELDKGYYFGCNVGRNANRISNARFTLNNVEYILEQNDGVNNLHSGNSPYSKRIWCVEEYTSDFIIFSLESAHLDQGYPGNLKIYIIYRILSESSFEILYKAIPDMDTMINITNHSYFNLNGEGIGTIENHKVVLNADYYTPTDECLIPTGEIFSVDNTPMDFRKGKTIGLEINEAFGQLVNAKGYDHNWIVNNSGEAHNIAAIVGDKTGISMMIATDYPGVQMYTGNFIKQVYGKKGHIYSKRGGVCFEPQFYPNAINIPEFVSPICKKGEVFKKTIIYSFDVCGY